MVLKRKTGVDDGRARKSLKVDSALHRKVHSSPESLSACTYRQRMVVLVLQAHFAPLASRGSPWVKKNQGGQSHP